MKYSLYCFLLIVSYALSAGCQFKTQSVPVDSPIETDVYSMKPLSPDLSNSLQYRWQQKKVIKETVVDGMENLNNWQGRVFIPGEELQFKEEAFIDFGLSEEQVFEGEYSLKLKSPTKTQTPMQTDQRMWDWMFVSREFENEDFSEYTRISAKVYPDCPGHKKIHLFMILQNGNNVPDKYLREGLHTVMLENRQWNDVVFEVPHLSRDQVKSISFVYRQQGNTINASDTVVFYIDKLAWQRTETEHFEGWNTNNDISFSHSGYNSSSSKTAITSLFQGKTFQVLTHPDGKLVLEKGIEKVNSTIGNFTQLDFSEVKKEGTYKLAYGNVITKPFPVKDDVWMKTLLKTINLYYCLRCGYEVQGVHDVCHSDWYTISGQDTVILNGGWHDAGDLSQNYASTSETTGTLFRLARKFENENPELSKRLLEEALWGLKWIHKNRFKDGTKMNWTVIDHWSDGIIGNGDDKLADTGFRVDHNCYAIVAEVEAMKALIKHNPELAQICLEHAKEDWEVNEKEGIPSDVAELARKLWAGCALYEVTKDEAVKQAIVVYADKLMRCQQKELKDWKIPLRGFFYTSSQNDKIFVQGHVVSALSPILGLVKLCKLFPDHQEYREWFSSVKLYAEYLKTMADLTAPYNMIPASVYKLGTNDNNQILQGIPLDNEHYLRMFPVWGSSRGNSPVILSYAISLAQANQLLKDEEIEKICQAQLEWNVGKNPFNQSLMYGEGYDYSPQFSAHCGDIVGGLPVGIQSKGNDDLPYWQPAVLYNYKEIWIHVSNRWMYLLESMYY
uniref:glycoside hydrolase family 9 protein n=1 Tax=uncultured Draconibacterium sp. TaxID=1573823 RepID=UPI00321641A7